MMRRLVLAMAVIGLGVAHNEARAQSDDSIVQLGVGMGPARTTGGLASHFSSDGQVSGRIYGGVRYGDWAFELDFFGTDLAPVRRLDDATHSTLSLGPSVRRYARLTSFLHIYVRGGVDYTWLVRCHGNTPPIGFAGSGYHYGAGAEAVWRWRLPRRPGGPLMDLMFALWVDGGRHVTELTKPGAKPLDARIEQLTFGFTVGFSR